MSGSCVGIQNPDREQPCYCLSLHHVIVCMHGVKSCTRSCKHAIALSCAQKESVFTTLMATFMLRMDMFAVTACSFGTCGMDIASFDVFLLNEVLSTQKIL